MQYDSDDLLRRAMAAHFRSGATEQPSDDSSVEEVDGLVYVVLRNVNAVLNIYRLTNQGKLRALRRWPVALKG